jgi:hypothetical protein
MMSRFVSFDAKAEGETNRKKRKLQDESELRKWYLLLPTSTATILNCSAAAGSQMAWLFNPYIRTGIFRQLMKPTTVLSRWHELYYSSLYSMDMSIVRVLYGCYVLQCTTVQSVPSCTY